MDKFPQKENLLSHKLHYYWSNNLAYLKRNPKKFFFHSLFYVLLLFACVYLVLFFRTSIRQSQINTLIFEKNETKQLMPLTYNKLDETIDQSKAISILFANPSRENYQKMLVILKEQEKELNRKIYFYPLIYSDQTLVEKYQLNPNEITFVFFEGGIEKNRFTFESLKQANKTLIPELNRLPMWNMKFSEESTENSN